MGATDAGLLHRDEGAPLGDGWVSSTIGIFANVTDIRSHVIGWGFPPRMISIRISWLRLRKTVIRRT